MIEAIAALFFEKGDIGHVALFLWAASASALTLIQLRVLSTTAARFEAFVLAIARLNAMLVHDVEPSIEAHKPKKPTLHFKEDTW